MKKAPTIWKLMALTSYVNKRESETETAGGRWVPARPLGLFTFGNRFRAAWLVFTGKADVVTWPGGQ